MDKSRNLEHESFSISFKDLTGGLSPLFLLSFLFLLLTVEVAYGANEELKPVLKAIDPSMAKMDKEKPEAPPEVAPNYKYTPYQSPEYSQDSNQAVPQNNNQSGSGGYGMAAPKAAPYVPSKNPNSRYNQVFTPPWQKKQPQAPQAQQAPPASPQQQSQAQPVQQRPTQQTPYGSLNQNLRPTPGLATPQYQQQPAYNPNQYRPQNQPAYNQNQYRPPQQFQQPAYNQNQYRPPQQYQQPAYNQNQYQPPQQYQQPAYNQNQYQPPQQYQQPAYNQNQYRQPQQYQPAFNQNQYRPPQQNQPVYNQNQYRQPQQNAYQPTQHVYNQNQIPKRPPQQNTASGNGFPSDDMIPDFNKPMSNLTNKGPAAQKWTSNARQNQFRQTSNAQPGQFQRIPQANDPEARVAKLEQTAFGSTYPEHDVEARLDHLEKEIFGSKSSGPVEARLSKLEYKLGGKGAFSSSAPDINDDKTKKNKKKVKIAQKQLRTKSDTKGKSDIGTAVSTTDSSQLQEIIDKIPFKKSAGDYFASIKKFPGNTVARWQNFPVKIRIPENTDRSWKEHLNSSMETWNKYLPVTQAGRAESADIEISWVNHLPPKILAVTRLTAFNSKLKVRVFMLRPTYYVPSLKEEVLSEVFTHELGHALGLFGHSSNKKDTMYLMQLISDNGTLSNKNTKKIGKRDLNTLRRVYESPPLPDKYSTGKPLEWTFLYDG